MHDNIKLIIIGCGRSGTTYIAKIFQSIGLDIKHEKMGVNGTSDWHLTTGSLDGKATILHQVRHPLKAIASMFTAPLSTWKSINKYIPLTLKNILVDGMRYWYFWNLIAESKACYTYRIENLKNEWDKLCGLIGIDEISYGSVSVSTNSRMHGSITWEDMEKADAMLSTMIRRLSVKYGY
jgi:hypothetical protein